MTRQALTLCVVIVALFVVGCSEREGVDAGAAGGESCQAPAGYYESIEENRDFMLRVLASVNRRPPAPVDPEQAAIFFAGLASSRRYYEGLQPELPACADELNRRAIGALTATQDLVSLQMARAAAPEWQRVDGHLDSANEHFTDQWSALQEALAASAEPLVAGAALRNADNPADNRE